MITPVPEVSDIWALGQIGYYKWSTTCSVYISFPPSLCTETGFWMVCGVSAKRTYVSTGVQSFPNGWFGSARSIFAPQFSRIVAYVLFLSCIWLGLCCLDPDAGIVIYASVTLGLDYYQLCAWKLLFNHHSFFITGITLLVLLLLW